MYDIVASIVTFNNNLEVLETTIKTFLLTKLKVKLVILDNSLNDDIKSLSLKYNLEYITPDKNIGFGKAHNISIKKYTKHCKYYLVLNPDIVLNEKTLITLKTFLDGHNSIGLTSPRILNTDGTLQRVHKRLPTFEIIFARRFLPNFLKKYFQHKIDFYEIKDYDFTNHLHVPSVSGCFMLFRSSILEKLNGFDERYFMYFEDIDISRRSTELCDVVICTDSTVIHHWAKGSYKDNKLTLINISSALKYFTKWFLQSTKKNVYQVRNFK